MEISRLIEDGITIMSLSGNLLGEKDATPIISATELSIENGSSQFVIDLSEMKYINSTGLSVLLTVLTKSRNANGDIRLINIPEQLESLLNITKLAEVFPKSNSKEEALASFK